MEEDNNVDKYVEKHVRIHKERKERAREFRKFISNKERIERYNRIFGEDMFSRHLIR